MSEKDITPLDDDDEPETYRMYAPSKGWKAEGIRPREVLTFRRILPPEVGQVCTMKWGDKNYLFVFLNFNEEGMAVRCKGGGIRRIEHGSYLINGVMVKRKRRAKPVVASKVEKEIDALNPRFSIEDGTLKIIVSS